MNIIKINCTGLVYCTFCSGVSAMMFIMTWHCITAWSISTHTQPIFVHILYTYIGKLKHVTHKRMEKFPAMSPPCYHKSVICQLEHLGGGGQGNCSIQDVALFDKHLIFLLMPQRSSIYLGIFVWACIAKVSVSVWLSTWRAAISNQVW